MIYDPEANILSWEVGKGKIVYAREFGNMIIHLSKSGRPIMIEMLDASKFKGQFDKIKEVGDIPQVFPAPQI
jgi:hypothetical protein